MADVTQPFSLVVLMKLLPKYVSSSALGMDGITYDLLCSLNEFALTQLLEDLNSLWIQHEWRTIYVVPIPRGNKDLPEVGNLRPISIKVFAKRLNTMVKN